MKNLKHLYKSILLLLFMFPFPLSSVKATGNDRQEKTELTTHENLRRLQKLITNSTGLVQLPDFKYSQVVQSSEGPLLQTLLQPAPHRGFLDKILPIPKRPLAHGPKGVTSMSSEDDDGSKTSIMQITSKQDKHGNIRGKSDMGAPGPQNKVSNFMTQHSSGKHATIYCYNKGTYVYKHAHKSCPCHTDPFYNMQIAPPAYHVKKVVNGRFKWVPVKNQQPSQTRTKQKHTNWRFDRNAKLPLAPAGQRWAWTQTQNGYQWIIQKDPNKLRCFSTGTYMTIQYHNSTRCRCRSLGYGDTGPGLGGNVSQWQYQGRQEDI